MLNTGRQSAAVGNGQSRRTEAASHPAVAIDLFSGAGGMSLGFEAAGFVVLLAVDNNPIHVATHEWNFPHTYPLCADIMDLSAEDVVTIVKKQWLKQFPNISWPNDVDCIFGGPSCQGFSEIGRRDPRDERNSLLAGFARLVVDIGPKYFVMENVPGLLAPINGALLREVLQIFSKAGYRFTSGGPVILNTSEFGVPQARRRVFVVGSRSDMPPAHLPVGAMVQVTVAEALDDLRCLERYATLSAADCAQLSAGAVASLESKASPYVQSLRNGVDAQHGSYGLGYDRPWDRTIATSSGRTSHRRDVIERFRLTPEGAEEKISRLPRLRSDGLAPTLRAGTGRDHGSFTSARPIHHFYPRVITVREAARLHSFPDWFQFHVTKWHGFQQIGNSVPPHLARAVAESIVNELWKTPAKLPAYARPRNEKLLIFSLVEAAVYYDIDPEKLPKDNRARAPRTRRHPPPRTGA